MEFINAFLKTIDPKGGNGLGETVIILALIVSVTVLAYFGREIPPALIMLVSAIAGVITGYKVGGNKEEKGTDKNDL